MKSEIKPATRVPVPLSERERAEIEEAMRFYGIRAMSEYLRFAGLKLAREPA